MLLENMGEAPAALNEMRARISHAVRQPVKLPNGQQVSVGVSIGSSVYRVSNHDTASLEDLLKEADGSMYAAKPRSFNGQPDHV